MRSHRFRLRMKSKTLVNGLKNSQELSFDKETIEKAILACGLPLTIRGEALTLEQFAQLANMFSEKQGF